jgi:hypothetical protein
MVLMYQPKTFRRSRQKTGRATGKSLVMPELAIGPRAPDRTRFVQQ